MKYDGDAFISYAHLDNVGLAEGHKGWVEGLQRALEIRVGQLLGKHTEIWWDPKLQGNDVFAETLVERLRRVAALISVVSPRYVRSEWGRRELVAFVQAAQEQGGLNIGDKSRLFKVLKTPVPLEEHPPELQTLLGYEFFRTDPATGKVRELNEIFGPEAERDFWLRLDDLAHDVSRLLEVLEDLAAETPKTTSADDAAIFLAETTADLREPREAIKRDLEQHGHTVLPARPLPLSAAELETSVRADLARCRMSIHMIGRNYSLVPEGAVKSVLELQEDLAVAHATTGRLTRLIWFPPGLEVIDERQRAFVQRLRLDPRVPQGADLLETSLDDLKTLITERLTLRQKPTSPATAPDTGAKLRLYLIYDQRDTDSVFPWQQYFFERGFEVLHPLFEGDEAEVREYHEENLRVCDAALLVHGAAAESWLRKKLRELEKIAGLGRVKPRPVVAICLAPPRTVQKERFRTHDALVLPMWDGFAPEPLQGVVAQLSVIGR
jgi:TIR domain